MQIKLISMLLTVAHLRLQGSPMLSFDFLTQSDILGSAFGNSNFDSSDLQSKFYVDASHCYHIVNAVFKSQTFDGPPCTKYVIICNLQYFTIP